uniref:Pseudouridylate synthase n=1 Tax=Arundo donax TaxID=35708 RepID=A0A0A9BBG3_ARUDO
MAGVRNPRA